MTAEQVFSIANMAALLGWIGLAASGVLNKPFWRDEVFGRWLPLGFSAVYFALMLFFFRQSEGGFGSLPEVQLLFANKWVALAGWVHYLAFDLFIGAVIARRLTDDGMTRWLLLPLLPLTFLFGPIGLLGFEIARALHSRSAIQT